MDFRLCGFGYVRLSNGTLREHCLFYLTSILERTLPPNLFSLRYYFLYSFVNFHPHIYRVLFLWLMIFVFYPSLIILRCHFYPKRDTCILCEWQKNVIIYSKSYRKYEIFSKLDMCVKKRNIFKRYHFFRI